MRSLNSHIKINKLLDYSKEIRSKDNKLPKVIIIFDDESFDRKKLLKLKIPKKSAILLRSYETKKRKKIAKQLLNFCKMNSCTALTRTVMRVVKKYKT